MPFHHPSFFLLFCVTLAFYWVILPRWQHLVLLASSLAFYYYAGLVDSLLLLFTVGANHLVARAIDGAEGAARRRWLVCAVITNLMVLAYWKYRVFVVENVNALFPGVHLHVDREAIPLGISFYVFQLIAYQVDLSRRNVQREPSLWRLLLYILFFPHHQAGPIMRPAAFLPQFYGQKQWDPALARAGGFWLLSGLAKKVLADQMAPVADKYFDLAATGEIASWQAWRAAMAFGFQIYGDFSGYSDIAVGLGYLLGYRLDVNFKQPYLAADPSEFWRRWHITLSEWLRDYLYIPLGGNRHGSARTYVNLLLTMLLGGLWHGASWMFVLWGAIHGLFLALHRALPGLFRVRAIGVAITFLVATAAWVPFRAQSMGQVGRILGAMVGITRVPTDTSTRWLSQALWMACIFGFYAAERALRERLPQLDAAMGKLPAPLRGSVLALAVAGIVLTLSTQSTYVYFRF